MEEEAAAYKVWDSLSMLEEKYLKQKSKLHWLRIGDRNNKVFHNAVRERAAKNAITEIVSTDGEVLTRAEDIKSEAVNYFSTLLNHIPPSFEEPLIEELQGLLSYRCSSAVVHMLEDEVTEEVVKNTLFSMPNDKAPGPDGYTVEFYKLAWGLIGGDVTNAIKSFFSFGFLPKGANSTILALIPKSLTVRQMKDYRPISCCNVLYKIISKILANRLKDLLPEFISSTQSAFISNRYLMENVLLASEMVKDYHKADVSRRSAIKIDISKAFDSVQWSFILCILRALQFPAIYIHWIKLCISTAGFSVQVNGELAGYFSSSRGLRQGCSLSPYLFVICMNVLSLMLDRSAQTGGFGYHPSGRPLHLTNLCFADDILIFTDGSARSITGVFEVFKHFEKISGLQISRVKSTIFVAGITASARDELVAGFGLEVGELPVRYLGLPLLTKRMSKSDCLPLIEKINARFNSWKHRFLSYAGRLQLLTSVISSLTNFWISAFRLPSSIIKEIEQVCSRFLWSGPSLDTHKAKVSWVDVCKPKEEGGLGIKSLQLANKVSCFKLIWRILSARDSLWVNWIHRHLIRTGSFWSVKTTSTLGSWMWKKLLKYRQHAKPYHRTMVQSGREISFWFDSWSPLGRLHDLLGNRGYIDLGIAARSSVADAVANHRRRRHRLELLNQIEASIFDLQVCGLGTAPDTPLWRSRGDQFKPSFSSKDMWNLLRPRHITVPWHKGVWFSHSTPKFCFITWLTILNRLATGDRMRFWSNEVPTDCVLCSGTLETRNHLFFLCRFSSQVWSTLAGRLLGSRYTPSFDNILSLLTGAHNTPAHGFLLKYLFQSTIYNIWQERNRRRHGETPTPTSQIIRQVDRSMRNRLSSLLWPVTTSHQSSLQLWFQHHSTT